jgi:hypothetical protein
MGLHKNLQQRNMLKITPRCQALPNKKSMSDKQSKLKNNLDLFYELIPIHSKYFFGRNLFFTVIFTAKRVDQEKTAIYLALILRYISRFEFL